MSQKDKVKTAKKPGSNVLINLIEFNDSITVHIVAKKGFRPSTGMYSVLFLNNEDKSILFSDGLTVNGWCNCKRDCGYRDIDIEVVVMYLGNKLIDRVVKQLDQETIDKIKIELESLKTTGEYQSLGEGVYHS